MSDQSTHHDWAVIMAGGGGTRLWPASRRACPKQLLPLVPNTPAGLEQSDGAGGSATLLGATVARLVPLIPLDRIVVVTAAPQAAAVRALLPSLPADNVLEEPCARNTAACIGYAAVELRRRDPAAVMAVLPADHYVAEPEAFRAVVANALTAARERHALVTCGIAPRSPETGYGYIELDHPVVSTIVASPAAGAVYPTDVCAVQRFVEKPDLATARSYVASGRHLWNSGMFFFSAERILEEMRRAMPELAQGLARLAAGAPLGEVYPRLPSQSIDYGVMERATGILAIPGQFGWSDVGSWSAIAELGTEDLRGNRVAGRATLISEGAGGNLVYAREDSAVALIGVDGLCVVMAGDAVLVCPVERSQEVRRVVEQLGQLGLERFL
jgi:mannose-1-phosphate guanylyltransferase